MIDIENLLELFLEKEGLPSLKTIIEARIFVNHHFPDLVSRQAFLLSMTEDMCKEFGIDICELLDRWKRKVRYDE